MKNEIEWKTAENGELPWTLDEKGLGLKGSAKFFFYVCSIISLLSMIWVIVISVGVFAATKEDPTLPTYYPMVSVGCIALSMMCINTLVKFYISKIKYEKHVEIAGGSIKYKENDTNKQTEWSEKLRKYQSVELRHYNYRGVSSWYILLNHQDKSRRLPIFAPEYNSRVVTEEAKREKLSYYGNLFKLPEVYLDLEASYKKAEEESSKKNDK